jgi:ankyrin repeat protein
MAIHPPTDWTNHPLHVAAMSGNKPEVERLLAQGADVNEGVRGEGTPLHVAIRYCHDDFMAGECGHLEVVRLLLLKGADVHATLASSGTPLHDAAHEGHLRLAELLIAFGAALNSKEEDHRRTPLHRAVAAGERAMVQFLIAKGADVNAVADFDVPKITARAFPDCGMTPLHVAAREGYLDIARQLVAAGAATGIKLADHRDGLGRPGRTQGLTAFELARRAWNETGKRYAELLELLETAREVPRVR